MAIPADNNPRKAPNCLNAGSQIAAIKINPKSEIINESDRFQLYRVFYICGFLPYRTQHYKLERPQEKYN